MSPRLLRFLLVYVLVGLTFTALASGATERVLRAHFDGGPGTVPRSPGSRSAREKVACCRQVCKEIRMVWKKWVVLVPVS